MLLLRDLMKLISKPEKILVDGERAGWGGGVLLRTYSYLS